MADPRFYDNAGPFALGELAARIGGRLAEGSDGDLAVRDVTAIASSAPGLLGFAGAAKYLAGFAESGPPGPVIVTPALAGQVRTNAVIIHDAPAAAFALAAAIFYPGAGRAVAGGSGEAIDHTARMGKGVILEPGVVIGPDVEIGAGSHVAANAVIGRGVRIGRDCFIGPSASVMYALVGDRVRLFAGVRIGADGFGYTPGGAGVLKVPQLGRVIIQDDVEIGANSCVDRGALDDTVIGEGAKIDNLSQIAHNCRIGRYAIIAAQFGMAGSARVGDFVLIGGQSAMGDHASVGDFARLGARTGVASDLPGGADYAGAPARPAAEWRREIAAVHLLAKRKRKPNA